jgi:hypothetical protein
MLIVGSVIRVQPRRRASPSAGASTRLPIRAPRQILGQE